MKIQRDFDYVWANAILYNKPNLKSEELLELLNKFGVKIDKNSNSQQIGGVLMTCDEISISDLVKELKILMANKYPDFMQYDEAKKLYEWYQSFDKQEIIELIFGDIYNASKLKK